MVGICYVAPDVEVPSPRGASTHILELSLALQESGNEVHVLCGRTKGQLPIEKIRGVTFHRLYRLPGGLISPPGRTSSPRNESELEGLESRAYRIYLQTANAIRVGLQASGIVKHFRLHAILERETAYGAGAVASLITSRLMLLEIIGPRTSPFSVSRCFRLFAYSPLMVPKRGRGKSVFVEAAVNTDLFKPDEAARSRVRSKYGLEGRIVVGYVGTFQSFHGISDLLKAAALALRQSPELRFVLVGPFSDEAKVSVQALGIADSVIFCGPVKYEDVPAYLNASDILVAPYNIRNTDRRVFGIGSPLKVLEYMAVGKVTIGSDLPQVKSIIDDRRTGLLFPEGDVEHLAEAILELALNPELRESLGKSGLELVRARYAWSSLATTVQSSVLEGALVQRREG
jgi:glycosyltransferase involved in cell wall biosynthesis